MDVVVKGRHCEVSDRFREHVDDKLAKLEKFDHRVMRVDVEVSKERNPRQAGRSDRVELTVHSRGPVVRAEAEASDQYAALDMALDRLRSRLRKAADRRRVHHGSRSPVSVAQATAKATSRAELNGAASVDSFADARPTPDSGTDQPQAHQVGPLTVVGDGPMVVREKTHQTEPMTLDQALYEMEMVGHDFYLFVDAASRAPSVVYRRRGYDYGVIRLEV